MSLCFAWLKQVSLPTVLQLLAGSPFQTMSVQTDCIVNLIQWLRMLLICPCMCDGVIAPTG